LRLKGAVERAAGRGVRVLITNANHASIKELYREMGQIYKLSRASIVSADREHRGQSTELAIIIGYEPLGGRVCGSEIAVREGDG
jgi:DNA adenine methylase